MESAPLETIYQANCLKVLPQLLNCLGVVPQLHDWFVLPQSVTGCLGLALVFMGNGALREKFNYCFSRVFH